MKFEQWNAWVSCDDIALPEYATHEEGNKKKIVACFIPSEVGKARAYADIVMVVVWADHVYRSSAYIGCRQFFVTMRSASAST